MQVERKSCYKTGSKKWHKIKRCKLFFFLQKKVVDDWVLLLPITYVNSMIYQILSIQTPKNEEEEEERRSANNQKV